MRIRCENWKGNGNTIQRSGIIQGVRWCVTTKELSSFNTRVQMRVTVLLPYGHPWCAVASGVFGLPIHTACSGVCSIQCYCAVPNTVDGLCLPPDVDDRVDRAWRWRWISVNCAVTSLNRNQHGEELVAVGSPWHGFNIRTVLVRRERALTRLIDIAGFLCRSSVDHSTLPRWECAPLYSDN